MLILGIEPATERVSVAIGSLLGDETAPGSTSVSGRCRTHLDGAAAARGRWFSQASSVGALTAPTSTPRG